VPVWVPTTDAPVCMCERGGCGLGGSGLRSVISQSYTLRYVSLAELGHVCQFGFRQPMHLCVCVSEEGGDGEGSDSEASSLLSCTLRYVSLAELVHECQFGLREPMHLCACVSEEVGDGEGAEEGGDTSNVLQ
jgi:hypothetical protein